VLRAEPEKTRQCHQTASNPKTLIYHELFYKDLISTYLLACVRPGMSSSLIGAACSCFRHDADPYRDSKLMPRLDECHRGSAVAAAP